MFFSGIMGGTTGIVIIIFAVIAAVILGVSYYVYCITFKAPKRDEEEQYALPVGEQYEEYNESVARSMQRMRDYPCEEITITAHDGLKLFGRYYHIAEEAPVEILFHGYKGSAFRDYCGGWKLALKMGHNALVVDERSHNRSEGNTITFGIKERRDVLSWITYINQRTGGKTQILLGGVSMGAATVLMAGGEKLPENVRGIIADSPFSSPKEIIKKVGQDMGFPPNLTYPFVKLGAYIYGHFNLEETDALRAVKKASVPILICHGTDDRFVPHYMSEDIAASGGTKVQLELFPGAGHVLSYKSDEERYEAVFKAFVDVVLR